MLGKIADNILKYFFFYFSKKTGFGISCTLSPEHIVYSGDNLHEMSKPIFWDK